jgi:hypothetical protein
MPAYNLSYIYTGVFCHMSYTEDDEEASPYETLLDKSNKKGQAGQE